MQIRTTSKFNFLRTPPVPWKSGWALPARFSVEIDDEDAPYLVELDLVVEAGEVLCDAARFRRRDGGPPITPRGLRTVPLARYSREAAAGVALRVERQPDGSYTLTPATGDDEAEAWETARKRPAGGKKWVLTEDHLQAVADVYRQAVKDGRPPRRAVETDPRWQPCPPSTASRWIRAARDARLLKDREGKR